MKREMIRFLGVMVLTSLLVLSLIDLARAEDAASLVGCWHFDEEKGQIAKDSSGNKNNGEIRGATWVKGISGSALQFDGKDDYVDCGKDASLDIKSALTVEAWVKFNQLDYTGYGKAGGLLGIAGKGRPDRLKSHYGWVFSYSNRNQQKKFSYTCFGNSNGGYLGGGNNFSASAYEYIFFTGRFYHIAFSITQTEAKLYIDGKQHGPAKPISNLQLSDTKNWYSNLTIGKILSSGYFNGVIDEVRIYNRALSADDIARHYYKFVNEVEL
ncbi:LamG domain-containing protein [bacterium]|nr:LamG domain-containing protein [bacterium]